MSSQRYIDTSFWDDSWVQELDPSEKLLYIYLLTNPLTNIAGVMELTVKRIAFDTGFSNDTINHILEKFEAAGKVFKYNNYIIIRNFPKHQQIENEKILKGITAILCKLPDEVLRYLEDIHYELNIREAFDTLCIPYTYPTNYLNLNKFNNNLNLNEIDNPPKEKKEPLRNREPKNDLEKIEKTYLKLWDSLYSQNKVNTQEPIISDWNVIRKIEKGLLKNIPVEKIQMAIENSVNNDFVIQNGYSLKIILSANVINKLINGKTVNNKQGYTPKSAFVNNVYTPIEENPTPTFTEEELKEFPF